MATCPVTVADREQGRRPENRPCGDDSDPGLASRRESDPTARRGTLKSASTYSEGKESEDPGVVAPLAGAGCRGNRRYDMKWHMSAFSSPSRATLTSPSTPQILPLCSGQMGESSAHGGINVPSLGFADDSTVSSAVVFQVQIASFGTPSVRENAAQFLFLGVPGLVAEPADTRMVTEDQRSLAFVGQFVLVSGLVWNRHSDISVPRTCAMYTGWCPLAKHVPPLDRSRVACRVCKPTSYFLCCDFSFTCDPVSLTTAVRIPLLLPISRLHHAPYDAAIM